MTFLNYQDYKRYLILNLIYHSGQISRTKLADATEYIPAVISNIVKELIDEKLVIETGSAYAGQGRRRTLLEINHEYLCSIGISISSTSIVYVVSTIRSEILKRIETPIHADCPANQIIAEIVQTLSTLISEFQDHNILGIGISDPGVIDPVEENSISSVQLRDWQDVRLKSIVEKATNMPVKIAPRTVLLALAEQRYGAAQGINDFIVLEMAHGIGISFVCNGQVVKGHAIMAGELGHTVVHDNDKICYCGNVGCVEQSTALPALKSKITAALAQGVHSKLNRFYDGQRELTVADIRRALDENDRMVSHFVSESARLIGLATANAVNILDPECIVFYGEMVELGDVFLDEIKSTIRKRTLPFFNELKYEISPLMANALPIGAASMLFSEFLKSDHFAWLSDMPDITETSGN